MSNSEGVRSNRSHRTHGNVTTLSLSTSSLSLRSRTTASLPDNHLSKSHSATRCQLGPCRSCHRVCGTPLHWLAPHSRARTCESDLEPKSEMSWKILQIDSARARTHQAINEPNYREELMAQAYVVTTACHPHPKIV